MGSHMGVTKWPKLNFFTFFHKKPPKRLILFNESAKTSCVISSDVNLSIGILIRGLFTTKVFLAKRNDHIGHLDGYFEPLDDCLGPSG